jgi:hypothetical protein
MRVIEKMVVQLSGAQRIIRKKKVRLAVSIIKERKTDKDWRKKIRLG